MATPYTGSPTGSHSPSNAPAPNEKPTVNVPQDTIDDVNAASVSQSMEVDADYIAYLMNPHFRAIYQQNFLFSQTALTSNTNPLTVDATLRAYISGAGGQQVSFSSSGASMAPGTSAGQYAYISTARVHGGGTSAGLNTQILVGEFDYIPNVSSTNIEHRVGFGGDTGQLDAATTYAYVQLAAGSLQWTLNVNGTTSTLSATYNATLGATTPQRIRIVCYGSATSYGIANGSAFTKVYINDVFATSVNASLQGGFAAAGAKAVTGSALTASGTCQCITTSWNRF